MRVLVLCNTLIEQVKEKLGISHGKPESWIDGIYNRMKGTPGLEAMYLFPSPKNISFTEGGMSFHSYTQRNCERLEAEQVRQFVDMIRSFKPDVIHVFGTEYSHTLAMINAAEEAGCLEKVLVHIQGLVSVCAHHYCANLSERIIRRKTFRDYLRGGGGIERTEEFSETR